MNLGGSGNEAQLAEEKDFLQVLVDSVPVLGPSAQGICRIHLQARRSFLYETIDFGIRWKRPGIPR